MTASATVAPQPSYRPAQWRALGTYVYLVVADGEHLDAARSLAERMLGDVDQACSRFRDDSDLTRANAQAGSWVAVSPVLLDAVEAALGAAERTGGLVDPTLGLSLVSMGYDRDLAQVQARDAGGAGSPASLPPIPPRSGAWREVQLDEDGALLVPFGTALDLGATGKAFAADRISAAIAQEIGTGCILSLGGDVAVGVAADGEHPWQVSVSERPDGEVEQTLTLPRGGAATSTTEHRTWTHGGRAVHHVLDPATGLPVQRTWRTATVLADSCLEANAATTAALVLGERAPAWLTDRRFSARLVARDGTLCVLGDWPHRSREGHL